MTEVKENETVERVLRLTGGKYRFLKDVPDKEWTDAHEAELNRQIDEDPDDWESSEEDMARAMSFAEAHPDLAASIRRGRPSLGDKAKKHVSLRLDADVLDKFKATGKGWQGRINEALRKAAGL